jgi:hypothetical protein
MNRHRALVVLAVLALLLLGLGVLATLSTTSPTEAPVYPTDGLRSAEDVRERKRPADAGQLPPEVAEPNDRKTVPAREAQPAARRVD